MLLKSIVIAVAGFSLLVDAWTSSKRQFSSRAATWVGRFSSTLLPDGTEPKMEERPRLPVTINEMMESCAAAVERASKAGVKRQRVRILLPSPRLEGVLVPPDETWEGGIMQLYSAVSPLARDLVRKLSPATAGVPPRLQEQQLSESGVDGESLWVSECASPGDDVSCFVQPTSEQLTNIRAVCGSAKQRLVLMVNPQYRESDDTLDFIASNGGGIFSKMANFLGGKAAFVSALDDELGFESTYCLEQYVIRGSELKYFRSYPGVWQVYLTDDEGKSIYLSNSGDKRPDYNKVEKLLELNGVAVKALRDLGKAEKLMEGGISVFYEDL